MNSKKILISAAAAGFLFCGCQNQGSAPAAQMVPMPVGNNTGSREVSVIPQAIPGTPRYMNNGTTGGYAPSNVQAQLKIDVKDSTKEVKVIRDNADPFVITKPYTLKYADPYAVRSYLEAAVGSRSISSSPAQVMAVKKNDGTGVVLVSAEEYRFKDSKSGKGIDNIIKSLDRKGLSYAPDAGVYVYFPRISRAANLRSMLLKVGSHELDPQFVVAPSCIMVDGELNALLVKAPEWSWKEMLKLLQKYDRAIPEVKISYRVLEIYAENDDRIGVDFQSWKNNEGVDFFSAGMTARRNWGTFFTSGVHDNGWNRTSYWNFNPKWNTRYLDFMTSIGKAKCLAQGTLVAQNRRASRVAVNTGFFYDRTYYTAGATTIAEGTGEFAYADLNPDTIMREGINKIMPYEDLAALYAKVGKDNPTALAESLIGAMPEKFLQHITYTQRVMGIQTGTSLYGDVLSQLTKDQKALLIPQVAAKIAAEKAPQMAAEKVTAALTQMGLQPGTPMFEQYYKAQYDSAYEACYEGIYAEAEKQVKDGMETLGTSELSKYIGGYVNDSGNWVAPGYYNGYTNRDQASSSPGIIHGWLQYPMVQEGFKFDLKVIPVVTGKAAKLRFELDSISLMGWNSDGSARSSKSGTSTTVQIGYEPQEFVIGGLRKSESVRGNAGLPFLKDLPIIGRLFSTETESIKQSQLVLIARVELSNPDDKMGADVQNEVGKIIKQVNNGVNSPIGNMLFQQYLLDEDRPDRENRLDKLSDKINDKYQEHK